MRWLTPFLALLTAAPALAVDGVLEIDQTCATSASGCFAGDAPGFPVTVSQRGAYRLTTNLTIAGIDTTAIQITIDGVSIDLNGFSIVGPATCSGVPISSCSASGTGFGAIDVGNQSTVVERHRRGRRHQPGQQLLQRPEHRLGLLPVSGSEGCDRRRRAREPLRESTAARSTSS